MNLPNKSMLIGLTAAAALTVGGLLGANSGFTTGQTITSGGTATDQTNLTTIVTTNLNGLQGGASGDLTLDLSGLANGIYNVQSFWAINGGTDRSWTVTAEGTPLGTITRTSGTTFNYLISGSVAVTDGTLNIVGAQGPSGDDRRLISGLIVNAVPEPGSLALVGLGGLGVVCVLRRRRSRG